ncbi:MAG: hypothetical protein IJV27_04265 [Prevotella sp.]|nr:hypothetical protein [Prevotella sp.]
MKNFTLSLLALLAFVCNANATNLWTGSQEFNNWSGNISIAASALSDLNPGAVITVTYTENSIDKQILLKTNTDGWPNISNDDASAGPVTLMGYQLETIQTNGLILQGKGVTVTSVDYENPASPVSADAIWVGNKVFDGWSVSFSIPAAAFSKAVVGDIVKVFITNKGEDYNPIFKKNNYNNLEALQNVKEDGDGYFQAEISEEALTELQANGLRFQGLGFTLTEVQLISSTVVDNTLLWEGEYTASWGNTALVSATTLKKASPKVGDLIQVTIQNPTNGHQLLVYYDWSKMLPGTTKGNFLAGETTYVFGVTEENLAQMLSTGFFVSGSGYTVTEIRLVPGTHDDAMWFGNIALSDSRNGVEFYGTKSLSSEAKCLEVTVEGTPNWIQLSNSSWSSLGITPVTEGNVYKFVLTSSLKETISDFILQGTGFTVTQIALSNEALTVPVEITAAGYATLYYEGVALVVPENVTAYTYVVADNKLKVGTTYASGETIPKATAVVLEGAADSYDVEISAETGTEATENQLVGTEWGFSEFTPEDGNLYYILSYNKDNTKVGFYWQTADGKTLTGLGSHKAYLKVAESAVNQAKGFAFGDDETDGISAIQQSAEASDAPRYNVAGQRVADNYRGIVIQNGRKYMNK